MQGRSAFNNPEAYMRRTEVISSADEEQEKQSSHQARKCFRQNLAREIDQSREKQHQRKTPPGGVFPPNFTRNSAANPGRKNCGQQLKNSDGEQIILAESKVRSSQNEGVQRRPECRWMTDIAEAFSRIKILGQ